MYNALQVVNWLRVKNVADLKLDENAEELTQMKAMKLLYYMQAASLVLNHRRLFKDNIVAWKYGPAVLSIHNKYRHERSIVGVNNPITEQDRQDYQELQNNDQVSDILNSIYNQLGVKSAIELMKQTHNEDPWKNTPQSEEITDDKLISYFKDKFSR